MEQLPLSFPKVDSLIQLTLGTLRQIPAEALLQYPIEGTTPEISALKATVLATLVDLRQAVTELDKALGFDPGRYEVSINEERE